MNEKFKEKSNLSRCPQCTCSATLNEIRRRAHNVQTMHFWMQRLCVFIGKTLFIDGIASNSMTQDASTLMYAYFTRNFYFGVM